MQDLKHVFSYLKPYRRDLFLAVGLVFVECIFEMVIPMLMSDLVDQGVPSHDMQVIMLQGSKMIICAVLALITGLLYARFAARAANGFAAALREAEYRKLQQFDFANLDHFSAPSLVTRMTTDVTVMLNAVATGLRPLVRSPVMLFMGLGMAFLLNAKLTIVFLITTPILAAILAWIVTKVGPLYDRQQTAVDHLNGRVQEALTPSAPSKRLCAAITRMSSLKPSMTSWPPPAPTPSGMPCSTCPRSRPLCTRPLSASCGTAAILF